MYSEEGKQILVEVEDWILERKKLYQSEISALNGKITEKERVVEKQSIDFQDLSARHPISSSSEAVLGSIKEHAKQIWIEESLKKLTAMKEQIESRKINEKLEVLELLREDVERGFALFETKIGEENIRYSEIESILEKTLAENPIVRGRVLLKQYRMKQNRETAMILDEEIAKQKRKHGNQVELFREKKSEIES